MLTPSESGPNRWTVQRGLDARDGLLAGQIPTEMGKSKLCLGLTLLGSPEAALPSSAGGEAKLLDKAFALSPSPLSVLARNMGLQACCITLPLVTHASSSKAITSCRIGSHLQSRPQAGEAQREAAVFVPSSNSSEAAFKRAKHQTQMGCGKKAECLDVSSSERDLLCSGCHLSTLEGYMGLSGKCQGLSKSI